MYFNLDINSLTLTTVLITVHNGCKTYLDSNKAKRYVSVESTYSKKRGGLPQPIQSCGVSAFNAALV